MSRRITAPIEIPADVTRDRLFHLAMKRTGAAIEFHRYVRVGLMLIFEHRPERTEAATSL